MYMYYAKHELIVISLILTHVVIGHYYLFCKIVYNLILILRNIISTVIHLFNCSNPLYIKSCLRIVNVYPKGSNFINQRTGLSAVSFAFSLKNSPHLKSYLEHSHFSPPLSVELICVFVMQLDCSSQFALRLGSPWPSKQSF